MDRRRAAGALLALAACIATSAAAPTAGNNTALDLYDEHSEGCYYNFQHYGEGDRIMTNEPCLNCTCHNRMLMCYLRVCPFTKAIGQDCTVEKRADQCCPIVTCPDVPVDLLTSTSTSSPAEYGGTGLGKVDNYGCSINGKYFPEGAKVPPTPNKPCEHCYCIRNMTTCVMQECTLHVDGCTPIYHKDVCCPVRYFCDHPEDEMPALDDMTTTVRPTPGFLLTTTPPTDEPTTLPAKRDCIEDDQLYPDGALIKRDKPCEHCYCMKGDIVCVVQECGTPMENEGKNCTSLPPREGQCCPDTYICEGDELSTEPSTDAPFGEKTTLVPPRRVIVEGSGYRNDDEVPYTEVPTFMTDIEGSGEEDFTQIPIDSNKVEPEKETTEKVLDDKYATEDDEFIPKTTQPSLIEIPEVPPKVIEGELITRKDDLDVTEKSPAMEQETTSKYETIATEPTFIAEPTKPSADSDEKESSSTGETVSEPSSSEGPSKSDQEPITETPNIESTKTTVLPSNQELVKETLEPSFATTERVETETEKLDETRRTSPLLVMQTTESPVNTGDNGTIHMDGTTEIPVFEETTPKPSEIDIETDQNTVPVETEETTQPSKVDKLAIDEELELPSSTITALTSDEFITYDKTTMSNMEQTGDLTVQPEEEQAYKTESSTPVSKEDEYVGTTVPAFRKEDEATTSLEIATHEESEESSPSPEAVLTPSYEQPTTEKSTSHIQELDTTTIPGYSEFDEITAPKETSTESLIELSTFAHDIEKESVTSQENVISQGETTTVNPEDNEIEEAPSPGRIPGEGDCLLDGVTFKNDSLVPSNNKCYSDCKCISSIIKCDPIICSPPPEYMDNCQPRYDAPDSCCPTYICDHGKETIPPESHSHMAGTESPVPSPSIDCNGDQCEVIDKESQSTIPPKTPERLGSEDCESEGCEIAPQKPIQTYPEGCTGSQCTLPTESCTNGECEMSSQPADKGPIEVSQPCSSSEGCKDVSIPIHCEGDSCLPEIKSPQEISQKCQDQESCKSDVPKISSTPCNGDKCDEKPENIPSKDTISDSIPQPCENEEDCKQSQVPDTTIPVSTESQTNQQDKICLEENGCKKPDEATGEEHNDIDQTQFACTSTECMHQKPVTSTDTVASSESLSTDKPSLQEQSTYQPFEHVDETLTTLSESPARLPETTFETTTTSESKISITDDRFTTTPVPVTVSVEYSSTTSKEPETTIIPSVSDSSPQQDIETENDGKQTGKPELEISTETPKDKFSEEPELATKSTESETEITKSPEESSGDHEQTTVSLGLSTVSEKEKLPEQEIETDEKITELPSQVTEKDSELPEATTEEFISVTEPHKVETETQEISATDTQITTESSVRLDEETSTSDYETDQTVSTQDITETNRPVSQEDDLINVIPDRSGGEEEQELHTKMPTISKVTETSIKDTEMKEPAPTEIPESDLMVIQTTSVPSEKADTESSEETETKSPEETVASQEPETKIPEKTVQETETKAPEVEIPEHETDEKSPEGAVPSQDSETKIPDKTDQETETKAPVEAIPEHETESQSPTEMIPSQEPDTQMPDKTVQETETKAPEEVIPEHETETQSPTEMIPSQDSETKIPDKSVQETETKAPEEVIPEHETETQSPTEIIPSQDSETKMPDKSVQETETKAPEEVIPEDETETQSPTEMIPSQDSKTKIPDKTVQETETKAPEEAIPDHETETQSPIDMVPEQETETKTPETVVQETETKTPVEAILDQETETKKPEEMIPGQETETKEPQAMIPEKESDIKESDETQTKLPDQTTGLYESETKAPEDTISPEETSSEETVTKMPADIIPTKETETSEEVVSSEETPTTAPHDIISSQDIGTKEPEKTVTPEDTLTTVPEFTTESPELSSSSLHDEKEKPTESPMSLVTKIQQTDSTTPQSSISSEENELQTTSKPEIEILREDHTDKPTLQEPEKPTTDVNYPLIEEQEPVTEKKPEEKPEISSVMQETETEQPVLISVPVDESSLTSQESTTKEPSATEQKEPGDYSSQTPELPADVHPESTSAEPAISSVPPELINTVGTEASTEVSYEETTLGQDHTILDLGTYSPEITATPTSEIEQSNGPDTEGKVTDKPELNTEMPDVPKSSELPEDYKTSPEQTTTEQSYFTETQKIEPATGTTQTSEKVLFEEETTKHPVTQVTEIPIEDTNTDKTITQGPEAEGTLQTAKPTISEEEKPTETTKIDSEQQSELHKEEQLPTESAPIDSTQSLIDKDNTSAEPTQISSSETTPFLVELEEHTHKIDEEAPSSETPSEVLTTSHEENITEKLPSSDLQTESPVIESETSSTQKEEVPSEEPTASPTQYNVPEKSTEPTYLTEKPISEISPEISEPSKPIDRVGPEEDITSTPKQTLSEEEPTTLIPSTEAEKTPVEMAEKDTSSPKPQSVPVETTAPEEEFIPVTAKATTTKFEEETSTQPPQFDKTTKLEEKPSEISSTTPASEIAKPDELQPTDEIPAPEDESHFPPSGGYNQEPDYGDEDQAFGPGTCRYGGKVYVSAQQIPRDDPCDFCFCFRSDIICLQQSCPPPIHGCHEEPIQGFCCPRYECPVSMATTLNVTTTTTTTTTTLPPHFLPHAYKGAAQRRGCQIKGHTYKVGEVVRASSGPCLHCTCGGDGQMKCDPKACTPEPMLRQMIAAAVSSKRRR